MQQLCFFCSRSNPSPLLRPAAAEQADRGPEILAFNDFHGNIESPNLTVPALDSRGKSVDVPAGGVAYLAGALAKLRTGHRYTTTVSAGDLIGASPLASAYFLDEPTIHAMNALKLDLNAVGNHEFDRGSSELLRMQRGGAGRTRGASRARWSQSRPRVSVSSLQTRSSRTGPPCFRRPRSAASARSRLASSG